LQAARETGPRFLAEKQVKGARKMGKKKKRRPEPEKRPPLPKNWRLLALAAAAAVCLLAVYLLPRAAQSPAVMEKIGLLRQEALTDLVEQELGKDPAGPAGYAVFFSVCDGGSRAAVYHGTGRTLEAAWDAAAKKTSRAVGKDGPAPYWVKADVVYQSEELTAEKLSKEVKAARHEFYRFGLSFDTDYKTALLEAELNGAKIYDYDDDPGIDLEYLNTYLKKAGRPTLSRLPERCTVFQCMGWLCDETDQVIQLSSAGLDYGRRQLAVDGETARELIMNASAFLVEQLKEDGSFVYGYYPRFDREIENYNIVRHASTLWSLVCRYRLAPDDTLAGQIEQAIGYMLTQVTYDDAGRAYLYEEKADEIKLGGCGMAVVAMTEYMDAFGNEKYLEECRALGEGILTMLDQETGEYYHVLNGDFTRKERLRTVYYDGEATFALCRLYSLTGEARWLEAAKSAVEHFIAADYAQYKDHWVAYSMNEITKHIGDDPRYYQFAMENAQRNLLAIRDRDTTYHTYLELLMATFEVYDRMQAKGITVPGFDVELFLETIAARADRQLNGYFFPEYAMYMANPQRILHTFMVRHDGYRVRIDDVQHNIGGYYLYYKNYDKLVACGLPVGGT